MKEEMLKLATLQKYDLECREIENSLKTRKAQIETDEARLAKGKGQLEEKKKEARFKKMASDRLDQDIKAKEAEYKKFNYQLMSLKDAKSYDAMKAQLAELHEQIQTLETDGIGMLGELDELNKTLALYQEKVTQEEARIQKLKDDLARDYESQRAELEARRSKRESYAALINPTFVRAYNRLLALPDGKPLAEVQDRTCTGCYSAITLEDLESIKMQERITTCHSCNRILYIPQMLGVADPV